MLDTVIVGGGLCGVALARDLFRQGRAVALFEARQRLGGRILSVARAGSEGAADLGPSWFWPDTQPLIKSLVAELELASIVQRDDGSSLHLNDPDKAPDRIDGRKLHEGARRLPGGMAQLIDVMTKDLPPGLVYFNHVLTEVSNRADHVVLTFANGDDIIEIEARQVVLAIPPRLLEQDVRFTPALDQTTQEAMQGTATWMAAQAKVVLPYERAFWREAGQSGNAFVTHEQAVIGEIYDACDGDPGNAALGGFLALSPQLRDSFSVGLPLLMTSQMVQVFGATLEPAGQHYQDWANEPFTCSALDRTSPGNEHAVVTNPMLRRPQWGSRLHLAGSETAVGGNGYLEGALEAARRVELSLNRGWMKAEGNLPEAARPGDSVASINATSLARFSTWVADQQDVVFDGFRHRLNQNLAVQQSEQLTQRALLESMEDLFDNALRMLEGLPFEISPTAVERGRSPLTPGVQQPFGILMQSVFDDVIAFNRTSCALSNFPDEHQLSGEYRQVILRDIAAAWLEFSLAANRLLVAKANARDRRLKSPAFISVSS
ncbi:MAG TPA: FAD-dependent oxidoreductase [Bradyrhizobium sp.]|nr:FAD-dependent oxidoreductase [Bradyrhizobium sp.]